jgi:hypothetical protein
MTYWVCVTKLIAAKPNQGFSTPVTGTLNIKTNLQKYFLHSAFWLDTSPL